MLNEIDEILEYFKSVRGSGKLNTDGQRVPGSWSSMTEATSILLRRFYKLLNIPVLFKLTEA